MEGSVLSGYWVWNHDSEVHGLVKDIPELVMPLVWNIGKTLTSRIRADNKRYLDATNFARVTEI